MKKQIDFIMDRFNFSKVQRAMEAVNWAWASTNGVPEEYALRVHARELLEEVANLEVGYSICAGGFTASKEEEADGPFLRLVFCIDEERAYNE